MYTAPKRFTEDDLDQRIPLSVAQWHEHVNFCKAPAGMTLLQKKDAYLGPNAQFGLKGSINTQEACDAAGGTFIPVVFNWMVHVYPFEKDEARRGLELRRHEHSISHSYTAAPVRIGRCSRLLMAASTPPMTPVCNASPAYVASGNASPLTSVSNTCTGVRTRVGYFGWCSA
jgi:hypothetical protein